MLYNVILYLSVRVTTLCLYRLGCGNGKYLSVNHSVFKIGVDRCKRFTDIAREKENEVRVYINFNCTWYIIIYEIEFFGC